MKKQNDFDDDWLMAFYSRVTDQFSLSRRSLHNTHQWTVTLTFGIVTAVLTFLNNGNPYPNEAGFIVLLVTLPLMIRFLIRSCLEYSIQRKWQEIRNNMDLYFFYGKKESDKKKLEDSIKKYYFNWRSPISLSKNLWHNLLLAYLWPLIIYIGLITWGAISLPPSKIINIVVISVSVILIFEIFYIICYPGLKKNNGKIN